MVINDKVYGKTSITEPVLLELLKSPSILRLKNISQYGVPDKYYCLKNFSRYEHCIGVMILLRKLGATVEEQIAGLLHDVSVLAFSHVTDWVFGQGRNGIEDYHDSIHEVFVKNTEIPSILKKHGFSLSRLLDDGNFSLLEKSIPDLCADRVDYSLREFEAWLNPAIVKEATEALMNHNGEMVFIDSKTALVFASNFLELQAKHWGAYEPLLRYHLFANALKAAIDKKILLEKDFYKDEKFVLKKLENTKDKFIQETLKTLKIKELKVARSGEKILKKFRHVDPKVFVDGKVVKLSEINPKFAKLLQKHRGINEKGEIL